MENKENSFSIELLPGDGAGGDGEGGASADYWQAECQEFLNSLNSQLRELSTELKPATVTREIKEGEQTRCLEMLDYSALAVFLKDSGIVNESVGLLFSILKKWIVPKERRVVITTAGGDTIELENITKEDMISILTKTTG
ncbi:MAG: hypothetical protein V3T30_02815 [Thermodesulfobacteriota bacterium]